MVVSRLNSSAHIKYRRASKPFDPDVAADLIYETDPSIFKCLLNNDRGLARRVAESCWQAEDGFWTYRAAFTASRDARLVGIEIGYPGEEESARGSQGFVHIGKVLSAHETDIYLERTVLVEMLMPEPDKTAWYVGTLSVLPEAQGLGIGRRLLENAFERAAEKGFKQVQLDVYATNPAIDFYRAMGMEVLVESYVPKLDKEFGVPAHFRMAIQL